MVATGSGSPWRKEGLLYDCHSLRGSRFRIPWPPHDPCDPARFFLASPRLRGPAITYLTTAIAYGSRATLLFLLAAVHQEFVASLWCALCIEERGVGGAESALCGFGWDWFLRGLGGLFLVGAANCPRSLSLSLSRAAIMAFEEVLDRDLLFRKMKTKADNKVRGLLLLSIHS